MICACRVTWIVKVALERPLTFIVLALLILIFGPIAAKQTRPTSSRPSVCRVVGVAFSYTGLSPEEMSDRIIGPYERILTTTVDDVQHIESQSMQGIGIEKIFFQPDVDIRLAMSQVVSVSQTSIRQAPAGTQPPLILNYDASTVPVLQIAYSSKVLSEQQLLDLAQNTIRPHLATVRGAASPDALWRQDPASGGARPRSPGDAGAMAWSAQDVQNAVGNGRPRSFPPAMSR